MDYTELVKALHEGGEFLECSTPGIKNSFAKMCHNAADAISELQQTVEHYKGCADDWYKEACDYKAMVARWIPARERVPKYGTPVLAYGSRGGIFVAKYERARAEWDRDYWWKLNSAIHVCNPTHWMPLPAPPKEETE